MAPTQAATPLNVCELNAVWGGARITAPEFAPDDLSGCATSALRLDERTCLESRSGLAQVAVGGLRARA